MSGRSWLRLGGAGRGPAAWVALLVGASLAILTAASPCVSAKDPPSADDLIRRMGELRDKLGSYLKGEVKLDGGAYEGLVAWSDLARRYETDAVKRGMAAKLPQGVELTDLLQAAQPAAIQRLETGLDAEGRAHLARLMLRLIDNQGSVAVKVARETSATDLELLERVGLLGDLNALARRKVPTRWAFRLEVDTVDPKATTDRKKSGLKVSCRRYADPPGTRELEAKNASSPAIFESLSAGWYMVWSHQEGRRGSEKWVRLEGDTTGLEVDVPPSPSSGEPVPGKDR